MRYGAARAFAAATGTKARHKAKDRVMLDELILPRLAARPEYRRVLFVGCDWYTEHVATLFGGREYWTLEVDPRRARYGSERHIVGRLEDLERHFPSASLDLIICNGVIGWGLNDQREIEASLKACARTLDTSGVLLLGWDDVPEKRPVDVEALVSTLSFVPMSPPGLDGPRIETGTYARHTFGFWRRPPGA